MTIDIEGTALSCVIAKRTNELSLVTKERGENIHLTTKKMDTLTDKAIASSLEAESTGARKNWPPKRWSNG